MEGPILDSADDHRFLHRFCCADGCFRFFSSMGQFSLKKMVECLNDFCKTTDERLEACA